MILGEVGFGDVLVVLHEGVSAKIASPHAIEAGHRAKRLFVHVVVPGLARGAHQQERIEEGVINRTLQSVRLVQPAFGAVPGDLPSAAVLVERDLRPRFHFQRLAVDLNFTDMFRLAQNQAREVFRFDGSAAVGALRVHFRALVMFIETVERNPVAAVVARGVSQEADVIGRNLAFVAVLFEERVKPLTDERAGTVTGFLGNHPQARSALERR